MHEKELLEQYGEASILERIAPMLTEERIERIDEVLEKRLGRVSVAVEAPTDPHNALAVIRTAEAMGLYRMHLIATEFRKKRRTTCGSNRWIELQNHKTVDDFQEKLGRTLLIGACPRGELSLSEVPVDRPLCLIFGNEYRGLSERAREACDATFSIPMYGMVESYNLSVSAALAMQSIGARVRNQVTGDLDEAEKRRLSALYHLRSVGVETAKLVLKRGGEIRKSPPPLSPR